MEVGARDGAGVGAGDGAAVAAGVGAGVEERGTGRVVIELEQGLGSDGSPGLENENVRNEEFAWHSSESIVSESRQMQAYALHSSSVHKEGSEVGITQSGMSI
mmetsp:Transcript_6631/g.11832  ORF Transcript_6631/g.11832 Transcript_6631/m.11832 type:complete len:103 (-) Transcript_6631:200-508(-)